MDPSTPPRPELRKPAVQADASDDTLPPFRLLDLPKEIRLMIYERLPFSQNRHNIPLQDYEHHITLVNPSISGVRILTTCRLIHDEASYALKPLMDRILKEPPKIIIKARHLLGLIQLRDGFGHTHDILDRILQVQSRGWYLTAVQRYRQGRYSTESLRTALGLRRLVDKDDPDVVKAVASFMLRVAKWVDTIPEKHGSLTYPALSMVIDIPSTYRAGTIVTTTSRTKAWYYRLKGIRRNRTHTGMARLSWMMRRFAYDMSIKCWNYKTLSMSVMLRYTKDSRGNTITVPRIAENGFRAAIKLGLGDAHLTAYGLLEYGGMVQDEGDEQVVIKPRARARTI